MYHHIAPPPKGTEDQRLFVRPDNFEKQMKYLSKHKYRVISLWEAVARIKGKRPLSKRSVTITFDDGYKDNYTNALPILKKYGFTATLFLPPGKIGIDGDLISWEEAERMSEFGISIQFHTDSHLHLPTASLKRLRMRSGYQRIK